MVQVQWLWCSLCLLSVPMAIVTHAVRTSFWIRKQFKENIGEVELQSQSSLYRSGSQCVLGRALIRYDHSSHKQMSAHGCLWAWVMTAVVGAFSRTTESLRKCELAQGGGWSVCAWRCKGSGMHCRVLLWRGAITASVAGLWTGALLGRCCHMPPCPGRGSLAASAQTRWGVTGGPSK